MLFPISVSMIWWPLMSLVCRVVHLFALNINFSAERFASQEISQHENMNVRVDLCNISLCDLSCVRCITSRPNWNPPISSPAGECVLPFCFPGGAHLAWGRWGGGPNSHEGTDNVVLSVVRTQVYERCDVHMFSWECVQWNLYLFEVSLIVSFLSVLNVHIYTKLMLIWWHLRLNTSTQV